MLCRPELKIKPWKLLNKDLEEANNEIKWENREPYAYWKGNAKLGRRPELLKCNLSEEHDWNARIYAMVLSYSIFTSSNSPKLHQLVYEILVRNFAGLGKRTSR